MENMKNNESSIFARRLNEALRDNGYSQSELARQVGVTPQAVQRWCNGLGIPRHNTIALIATATGKDQSWFFTETQSTPHPEVPDGRRLVALDDEEWELIKTYREFPGVERRNMLQVFERRLQELVRFYNAFFENKKD
jgi:transcriptional regulator with XRE-family HTH domain